MLKSVTPAEAKRLADDGAAIVDVREPDEFARMRIRGARNWPLSALGHSKLGLGKATAAVFCCQSGARTARNAEKLANEAGCDAFAIEGGIEAWRKASLPVEIDRAQPLPLMRQVQIAAGALVLGATLLGYFASGYFYVLAAAVGAGLLQAGITGWCGMAHLLQVMPWNRRSAAPSLARGA
jgi:rhodanese-related sulfurtransferase